MGWRFSNTAGTNAGHGSPPCSTLLAFQNADGGFRDVRDGIRRQDGRVGGYREPQGLSNTFATFFRWIAIAMIADVLFPGRWPWRFRRMIGIGYRKDAA